MNHEHCMAIQNENSKTCYPCKATIDNISMDNVHTTEPNILHGKEDETDDNSTQVKTTVPSEDKGPILFLDKPSITVQKPRNIPKSKTEETRKNAYENQKNRRSGNAPPETQRTKRKRAPTKENGRSVKTKRKIDE